MKKKKPQLLLINLKWFYALSILLTLSGCQYLSQQKTNKVTYPGGDNAGIVDQLPNGLRYWIRANKEPEHKAELRLVVRVGSLHEEPGQEGIAHFLEHMGFKTTRHFKSREIINYIESLGLRHGDDLNATTGLELTTYKLTVPTDKPDVLEKSIKIIRQWMDGMVFDLQDIESERKVILEELRLRENQVSRKIGRIRLKNLLNFDSDAIGSPKSLQAIGAEQLKAFYKKWYVPENMAVFLVGDFNQKKVEQLVIKEFTDMPKIPLRAESKINHPIKPNVKADILLDDNLTSSSVTLHFSKVQNHPNYLDVLKFSAYDTMFYQAFRERLIGLKLSNEHPLKSIRVFGNPLTIGMYSLGLQGVRFDNDIRKNLQLLSTIFRQFKQYGITRDEFNRIKKLKMRELTKNRQDSRYYHSANQLESYLTSYRYGFDSYILKDYYHYILDAYATTNYEDMQKNIQWSLSDNYFNIILAAPDEEYAILPSTTELEQIFKKHLSQDTKPYVNFERINDIKLENIHAGSIIRKSHNKKWDYHHLSLSNGINVILKKTDFRNDEVLMQGFAFGGSSRLLNQQHKLTNIAIAAIAKGSIDNYSIEQLVDFKNRHQLTLGMKMFSHSRYIHGKSRTDKLEKLLKLNFSMQTQYKTNDLIVNNLINEKIYDIRQRKLNPINAILQDYTRLKYQHHPRKEFITEKDIKGFNANMARKIYTQLYSDLSAFTFFIVGDYDENTIEPLLIKYIASLPSTSIEPFDIDHHLEYQSGHQELSFNTLNENKSQVLLEYVNPLKSYPYHDELTMHALVSSLRSLLELELREKNSLVYKVSVNWNGNKKYNPAVNINFNVTCAPQNTSKIILIIKNLLEDIKSQGITEKQLNNWKENVVNIHEQRMKSNRAWLSEILNHRFYGYDENYFLNYIEHSKKVSITDIIRVANKYFSADNIYQLVANPKQDLIN